MAEVPQGKVRGNRDSSLPVEAWAKGLSRAFSRGKTSSKSRHQKTLASIPDVPVTPQFGYTATITSSGSGSASNSSQAEPTNLASNRPIEEWMRTLPQRTPGLQPRNPRRMSVSGRPSTSISTSTTTYTSASSSPDSASIPTDWASDFERELPTANPFYERSLSDVVDGLSVMTSPTEELMNVAPLNLKRTSKEQLTIKTAPVESNQVSLRSLFFPGSTESREHSSTLSITTSNSAGRPRPLSRVSSIESFATADDGSEKAVVDDYNDDMGFDEDYSSREETEDNETPEYAIREQTLDRKMVQETVTELQYSDQLSDFDARSEPGTLEDVLVQIALSSPYASSDSDVSSQTGLHEDTLSERSSELPNETSSEKRASLPDIDSLESPVSISTGSIRDCQRIGFGKHYKMINGIIVQYDPWRIPQQFNASRQFPLQFEEGEAASNGPDRNFQNSGIFQRSGNKWSYHGSPMGVVA